MDEQDLRLARLAEREGRAIVIAFNKWDAVEDRLACRKKLDDVLTASLAQLRGIPVVPLSALTGLLELDVSDTWMRDLTPLSSCVALVELDCSVSQVADLAPLASLTRLGSLDCSMTWVTDLAPLSSCVSLKNLRYSSHLPVVDLALLAALPSLTINAILAAQWLL